MSRLRVLVVGVIAVCGCAGLVPGAAAAPSPRLIRSVAAADTTSCVVQSAQVACWGISLNQDDGFGVPDVQVPNRPRHPVVVPGITNVVAVSGWCALLKSGHVRCWSRFAWPGHANPSGRAVTLPGLAHVVALSGNCVVLKSTRLKCWGVNNVGQLGNCGGNNPRGRGPIGAYVSGVSGAVAVAAGVDHACALIRNGSVFCWGGSGERGDGSTAIAWTPGPVPIPRAVGISSGSYHTCAVLSNATVDCWGEGHSGELGNGAYPFYAVPAPVQVVGLTNAVQVSAGSAHTCALLRSGHVECWGDDGFGALGDGGPGGLGHASATPVAVVGISNAVSISAGTYQTCALLRTDRVECWGNYGISQVFPDSSVPVPVRGIPVPGL